MLPYVYRITKYEPSVRDPRGSYIGAESTVSDHGPVEAAYLLAVTAFAEEAGIDRVAIREPQVAGFVQAYSEHAGRRSRRAATETGPSSRPCGAASSSPAR